MKWTVYGFKRLPWLFVAACGLSLAVAGWGYLGLVHGLLTAAASVATEQGL